MTLLACERTKLLFKRLNAIYGYTWSSQFNGPEEWGVAEFEWSTALKNVSSETIKAVLDKCRLTADKFPPNIPAFMEMCNSEMNLPNWQETLQLALKGDVSHPITAECRKKVGSWLLKTGSHKEVEKAWKEAWYQVVQDLNKKIELRLVNN